MGTRINKLSFLITVIAMLVSGCAKKPQQQMARQNLSFLYNPSSQPLHPEFVVYHEGQFQSRLYVKVFTVELLFNQANSEARYQSKIKIRYELRELIDGKESELMADSATNIFTLKMEDVKNAFVANIPISTRENKQYSLKIYTNDILRNKGTVNYIHVDRSTKYTSQNFLVKDGSISNPSFDRVFSPNEIFFIQYNRKGIDSVYVSYYKNEFPLPRPPLTNLGSPDPAYKPDSNFSYAYSDTMYHILPREGMYHIQTDPNQPGGLTLFNFGDTYPRVTRVDDMVGPLAYLSSTIEFNELSNQVNKKLSVDNFWLQAAGNAQSARALIRVYYNRVFFANYFFTSYKEGWMTDRGMMFIVYGPPNVLTKRGDTELWVYYRKKSSEPLQFTFSRHENRFTHNDFLLERNYVNSMWVQAIQNWRQGKIFSSESN